MTRELLILCEFVSPVYVCFILIIEIINENKFVATETSHKFVYFLRKKNKFVLLLPTLYGINHDLPV